MSFEVYELVDKETYQRLGEKSWWMLNEKAVKGLFELRKAIGKPITVNNWFWGGNLENSKQRGKLQERQAVDPEYLQKLRRRRSTQTLVRQ